MIVQLTSKFDLSLQSQQQLNISSDSLLLPIAPLLSLFKTRNSRAKNGRYKLIISIIIFKWRLLGFIKPNIARDKFSKVEKRFKPYGD